jgi:hypothetical protein
LVEEIAECEFEERGGEVVDSAVVTFAKGEIENRGGQFVNWVVEIGAKSEANE